MLIGKYWDEANQKHFWSEGQDFDDLLENLGLEVADYGGDGDINPAKIEVWKATKMKVVAKYEIEAAD